MSIKSIDIDGIEALEFDPIDRSPIFFDIETGPDGQSASAQMPEFSAPSNWKDPEKIAAKIADQEETWWEKLALNPLTGETPAIGTVENWMVAVRKILGKKKLATSSRRREDLNRASVTSQGDSRKSPSHPNYKPRLNWEKTVGKVISGIDPEKLQRDYRDERKREAATQKLAKQIINAGYRALSAVCHPDKKGGSKEAFKALTDAKNWLTEAIND